MKKIILGLAIIPSIAFPSAADDLITKIKNIQSMSADFTQKLIDSQSDSNIKSTGIMSLKKPQFFKWVTNSPNNQEIVSNGKKIWIYDRDLEQLIIKQISNDISQFPYLILLSKNSDNLSKFFIIIEKSINIFTLKPKNSKMINSISIKFTENNKLDCLYISSSLNQYTQIKFTNVKDNSNIRRDSNFNFKVPKGTDIIDETITTAK